MPALQVRDFPKDLYDQLKVYSAQNHRSMAQQTIAFVEAGLQSTTLAEQSRLDEPPDTCASYRHSMYEPESSRLARKNHRVEIFSRIDQLNLDSPVATTDSESIADFIRSLREDRTEHLMSIISGTPTESRDQS